MTGEPTMRSLKNLLNRVHSDERGAVSLETILVIGAIALPILIYLLKYGWPKIKNYFDQGVQDLDTQRQGVTGGS
jgi:Flp pilus assembly pilin Flp